MPPRSPKLPRTEDDLRRWAGDVLRDLWHEIRARYDGTPDIERDQRAFFFEYLGFVLLPGPTVASRVKQVEHLLRMQRPPHPGARYKLDCSAAVYATADLYVESLHDVDFSDLNEVACFDLLYVTRLDDRAWTRGEADAVVRHIVEDMSEDGPEPDIEAEIVGSHLEITGDWEPGA